jgi:serine/threonine-protein kinase HipA
MATSKKEILVFAHWLGLEEPKHMGTLTAMSARGKESFAFEYTKEWLKSGFSQMLDPDLQMYSGSYYPRGDKNNFGVFLDSCPDRWGRVLMQRREAVLAKKEGRMVKKLLESDFLLGVFDGHRMGALRFRTGEKSPFLNNNKEMASPPWTSLPELELASLRFEEDNTDDPDYLKWINLLIAPGSSLGGARPKASVLDKQSQLWIAKFPSKNDEKDVAAWEMVANQLAVKAGIQVAAGSIQKFNRTYNTYLTKRFDRTDHNKRIHFASAMTLLGHNDGEDKGTASYLELIEFLVRHGAQVETDLQQLWRRIVFNICIKNTDDHLRNHGFILTPNGWILSPAYDMNPNEYGAGLCLNITDDNNALDLDLALEIAGFCRLENKEANRTIKEIRSAISSWKTLAGKYKISKAEQERMEPAFELALF